jgi:hypothetical protein
LSSSYVVFSSSFTSSSFVSQHPVLNHHEPIFLSECEDQVSHQYKATGTIIFLHILISVFLVSKQ